MHLGIEIDVNGVYGVSARDQATGRKQSLTIHPSGGLSRAEVDRLLEETLAREADAKHRRAIRQFEDLIESRNSSFLIQEDRLGEEKRSRIYAALKAAREAAANARRGEGDRRKLEAAREELESSTAEIGANPWKP